MSEIPLWGLETLITELPDNPFLAAKQICEFFLQEDRKIDGPMEHQHYGWYLNMLGLFQAYCESHALSYNFPELGEDRVDNISEIQAFFKGVHKILEGMVTKFTLIQAKQKYLERFERGFFYEFSEGDVVRIQDLVNELRDVITANKVFDKRYKERLLKKLEELQLEVHESTLLR